jgi:hypothetical protein
MLFHTVCFIERPRARTVDCVKLLVSTSQIHISTVLLIIVDDTQYTKTRAVSKNVRAIAQNIGTFFASSYCYSHTPGLLTALPIQSTQIHV